jgi:hypothetical protein
MLGECGAHDQRRDPCPQALVPPHGAGAVFLRDRPRMGTVRLWRSIPMSASATSASLPPGDRLHAASLTRSVLEGNHYHDRLRCGRTVG